MFKFLPALALLVYGYTATAQNTKPKHPCSSPVTELYTEQNEKLPKGAIPNGKVTIRLVKADACPESVTYVVEEVYVVLVRGHFPLAQTTVNGNVLDLTEMQAKFKPGDRLYLEFKKVNYSSANGKTGTMVIGENWVFKKDQL